MKYFIFYCAIIVEIALVTLLILGGRPLGFGFMLLCVFVCWANVDYYNSVLKNKKE